MIYKDFSTKFVITDSSHVVNNGMIPEPPKIDLQPVQIRLQKSFNSAKNRPNITNILQNV